MHVVLASFSGYRAFVGVHRADLRVESPLLRPGTRVSYGFVSWGRTQSHAELQLVQGEHVALLGVLWLPEHSLPSYDPRTITASGEVVLTPMMLDGFHSGPATIRTIAQGGQQWLRVPAPKMKALPVQLSITRP